MSSILTFGPGETNQTFTVPILTDGLLEGDKTVRLELADCLGCFGEFVLGARSNAVVTILDSGVVEFGSATYTVDEAAGVAVIRVLGGTDSGHGFSRRSFHGG